MTTHSRMRTLLALLLALALVAAACGGGDDDDASSSSGNGGDSSSDSDDNSDSGDSGDDGADTGADQTATGEDLVTEEGTEKQSGGTLRIGLEAEPESLNPTNTGLAVTGVMMGQAIFDTLTVWDENDEWANNMSESWTPNDDFSSWDMKLREGITFTDGEVMDADAVLKTLNAQLADPLVGLVFKPTFDPDSPFEKVDDLTVRINALGPNTAIPAYFTTQLGMIGSPAWLDAAVDDPSLDQEPIGAGPFMLESRTQDFVTRLVRNENWWRDDEIYLDAVEVFPIQQESSRTDQLLSGDLELIHASDADTITRLRAEPDYGRIEDDAGEEFTFLLNSADPPFDDIRVRQAATHAFPEEAYDNLIRRGVISRADSFFAPGLFWHTPEVRQPTGQPELAAPLIEAYCGEVPDQCTDGKVDVEFQHNGPSLALDQIADVVRSGWEPFFNVTIQVIPQDQHINEVAFGLYDAATWRYHGQIEPDIEVAFWSCASIGGLSINWTRNCNEGRDALMAQQRATEDRDERYAIWVDIQKDLQESYAYIIGSRLNWTIGAAPNVNGVCDATTPDGTPMRCFLNGAWRLPQIWLSQ